MDGSEELSWVWQKDGSISQVGQIPKEGNFGLDQKPYLYDHSLGTNVVWKGPLDKRNLEDTLSLNI